MTLEITDTELLAEVERLKAENVELRSRLKSEAKAELERIRASYPNGRKPHVRKAPYKYPIPHLEIGQSFFVPSIKSMGTLRASTCYWQRKQPGKRFSILRMTANGIKGLSVVRWA